MVQQSRSFAVDSNIFTYSYLTLIFIKKNFHGDNELMIHFYIWDVSSVAKYMYMYFFFLNCRQQFKGLLGQLVTVEDKSKMILDKEVEITTDRSYV